MIIKNAKGIICSVRRDKYYSKQRNFSVGHIRDLKVISIFLNGVTYIYLYDIIVKPDQYNHFMTLLSLCDLFFRGDNTFSHTQQRRLMSFVVRPDIVGLYPLKTLILVFRRYWIINPGTTIQHCSGIGLLTNCTSASYF
jgi:hypothetical protein